MMYKILLAGDGGQGIQLLSDILCRAMLKNNLIVSHIPNYGLEQRGGVSLAFIKISDQEIAYPKFSSADLLLIMSDQARWRTEKYPSAQVFDIKNYQAELKENNILPASYNIFFLGVLANFLAEKGWLGADQVFEFLEKKLSTKPNWEENKKAWELGLNK